ncbi:hypothetical protein GCM10007423_41300 [Dyadobacter endophyticus]|uniref:Uncharacterized protein n=1 Tax=Dyadobacter endophyticus TaxID=1749036 RepID=A0ABQ1Z1E4_9BACT|nr:hypothetical protein [Dyadobacter endophyticus]GGH43710.1 hypothetical protein GCM10007423_41300 [Dyadobacter endophyticus]
MKLKVSLFILLAAASAGCVDIPDFSDTPKIYYNGISQETRMDSVLGVPQETEVVTITIDFEDGDGDLGASSAEVQDSTYTQKYLKVPGWNLEAIYELVTMTQNKDSTWSESILPGDRFKFFPLLKTDGKSGPIKGKLDLNARFRRLGTAVPTKMKFKVRIIDRAFHISNQTPETDVVSVPLWK